MKVLAIDTSSYVLGIAVADGTEVKGEVITNLKKNHSVRVMPVIESLLKECGIKPKELNRIVVAKGPGSYTGVRIGVTIAKTLAWTLGIELSGVSSLEALAANGRNYPGLICPLFDARRTQVYTGLYKFKGEQLTNAEPDQILLLSDWLKVLEKYNEPILFLGNDLPLHREAIQEALKEKAVFSSPSLYNPRPGELAFLGIEKEAEDIHSFVPNYIRLAEAEANWLASQKEE